MSTLATPLSKDMAVHMENRVDLSTSSQNRSFINSHPDLLAPEDTLYLRRTSEVNADKSENHVVTGMHLVFKSGDKNKLFDSFNIDRNKEKISAENPRVNVNSLLIACDVLEIHGELSLPECDVSIYARKLIFRNKGMINTSPLSWDKERANNADEVAKKPGHDGKHGRNAGNITVFVNEIDQPAIEHIRRFEACGGKGQDPGLGANGTNGYNARSFTHQNYKCNDSNIKTTYFSVDFDPPAYYIKYDFWWGLNSWGGGKQGTNRAPTNGTDALAPGVPGDAGDGGAFTTNQSQLAQLVTNPGGTSGSKPPNVYGGRAGTPNKGTNYTLKLWHDWFKKHGSVDKSHGVITKTAKGKDFAGRDAAKSKGRTSKPVTVNQNNAWLHPLQLQTVLSFMRDAYLGGERDSLIPLLIVYDGALREARPDADETGAVWKNAGTKWQAAQTEVATLLQRQIAQLDYFGNPAGYMPLLSLQSNMRLYDMETDRALCALLLAAWVNDTSNKAQSASKAFDDAIRGLQDENSKLVSQLKDAEDAVTNSCKQLDALRLRLDNMSQDLSALENKLYVQASQDVHIKAQIKFGIKMAGAICQVIPVGQPALGTVGKLSGIAADMVDGKAPDTISKMGDTIEEAKKAADKSKEAVKKAKKDGVYEEPTTVSKLIDGLGPALSQAGDAIGALQVPQSEIDEELEKLKAQSPEWLTMVQDITELNESKARIFNALIAALQVVGEGYGRLANNADAIFTMRQQNTSTLATLNMDAIWMVDNLGQKARISLQRALYLMVKAYETTVMKPIAVDWKMDKVLKGVTDLLKPDTGFDAATINAHVKALKPVFEDNINTVKSKLLEQYGFNKEDAVTLEFGLTQEQTSGYLQTLNETGSLSLDPVELGLILPSKQRMTLASLELTMLEFDPKGPDLPASGNLIISILPNADSTMRMEEKLYAVRSDATRPWTWTNHFSNGSTDAAIPSTSSLDLLNAILSSNDQDIKQKFASPPLWSQLELRVSFSPLLSRNKRPRISKLIFKATTSSFAAPTSQRVLDVRCVGAQTELTCSPKDMGDRGTGFGSLYRIYVSKSRVRLQVPAVVGNLNFSHWIMLGDDGVNTPTSRQVTVSMDSHALVYCCFEAPDEGGEVFRFSTLDVPQLARQAVEEVKGDRKLAAKVNLYLDKQLAAAQRRTPMKKMVKAVKAIPKPVLIRIAAEDCAQIVGICPNQVQLTVLESGTEWHKVQFSTVIGYCRKEGIVPQI